MSNKKLLYAVGVLVVLTASSVFYLNYPSFRSTEVKGVSNTAPTTPAITPEVMNVRQMPADGKREELRSYTNTQFSYSFAYPNDPEQWYLDAKKPSDVRLRKGKSGDELISVAVSDGVKPLDVIVAEEIKTVLAHAKSKTDADKRSITLGGVNGYYYSIPNLGSYGNAGVVVTNGDRSYVISGDDSTEENKQYFSEFLSNFKFMARK